MTADHKPKARRIAIRKRRSDVEIRAWLQHSFAHALTKADIKPQRAARRIGIDRTTAGRYKDGAATVNVANVLRDHEIWIHFVACLRSLESSAWKAGR